MLWREGWGEIVVAKRKASLATAVEPRGRMADRRKSLEFKILLRLR